MIQQELQQDTSCEKNGCCSTTEDGSNVCLIPQDDNKRQAEPGRWQKVRAKVMFGIACLASPCCTPLILSGIMIVLAGTPFAYWLGQNAGWIYGAFALLSLISFAIGFYWMRQSSKSKPGNIRPMDIQVIARDI